MRSTTTRCFAHMQSGVQIYGQPLEIKRSKNVKMRLFGTQAHHTMEFFHPENGIVESPPPEKQAVLLLNLGSPDAPDVPSVRQYLAQFLMDKRVVEKPKWLWLPILKGIILRKRPPKSAELYRKIWTDKGSPLIVHTQKLAENIQKILSPIAVYSAMTYGNPSLERVLHQMKQNGITRILTLPLFPQYGASVSGAALDALWRALLKTRYQPDIRTVNHYFQADDYIQLLADSITLEPHEILLFSFHGIPLEQHQAGDPYIAQCHATAQKVAERLNLSQSQYRVTFQSRFGGGHWVQPNTQDLLHSLPQQGAKHLAVICPGFACDCLETLEEIAISGQKIFENAGGTHFRYIPCLNSSEHHANALAHLLKSHLWSDH